MMCSKVGTRATQAPQKNLVINWYYFLWYIIGLDLNSRADRFISVRLFEFSKVLWNMCIINEQLTIEGPWNLQPEVWDSVICFDHDTWDWIKS